MKLTNADKNMLKEYGYEDEDFAQIQRALDKRNTKYEKYREVTNTFNGTTYADDEEPITREEAIKLLGRENFLSGVARSCFHYTAVRVVDGDVRVHFDSHNLFK